MTAVRGHSLLRRFRPDRPDVLVLFMALLLKSWHCCSSHGIAAQAGLDGTHERTSWNMQRSPCACSMSAVAETADAGLRSRHVHAAAAISVCRRAKTTQ